MQRLTIKVQEVIAKQPQWMIVCFASLAAFSTYSCMYAFRKTFTAATFDEQFFLGIHYKIWLITSQLTGYTLSKFIGIRFISELKPQDRAKYILGVIGIAQLALLLFAITPSPWNIAWMFFNGLPLGVVWGLVFSYLEGRKTTEILGAAVSVSFIFASGFAKSVGKMLINNYNISEYWMPFTTGLIFTLPLAISVWLLNMMPNPSTQDIAHRTKRRPMSKLARMQFLNEYIVILLPLTTIYIFLTVLRDIRDNFAAEIWSELGLGSSPTIFTSSEIPVGIGVLAIIASMATIKNNQNALNFSVGLVAIGLAINITTTILFKMELIGGIWWMIAAGFGVYIGYIAYHALLFERFIASFKVVGNIGFLFYFSDAIGYLGSVSSFVMKNFFSPKVSWVNFFGNLNISLSSIGILCCIFTYYSIQNKLKQRQI